MKTPFVFGASGIGVNASGTMPFMIDTQSELNPILAEQDLSHTHMVVAHDTWYG